MVTLISLVCKRGVGLTPCSPTDFVSHSTGRLCVRNKPILGELGSFFRSQSSLLLEPGGTIDLFLFQYLDCIRLPLIYSCQRIETSFRFLYLPSLLPRNRDFKPNILFLVRSHSRRGFSMFEPRCLITQQVGFHKIPLCDLV